MNSEEGDPGGLVLNYTTLTVAQLKEECRLRNLRVGGNKRELENRLRENDQGQKQSASLIPPNIIDQSSESFADDDIHMGAYNGAHREACELDLDEDQSSPIDPEKATQDALAIEDYFQRAVEDKEDDSEGEDDEEVERNELEEEDELKAIDNSRTHEALVWADKFILETRRKGGRQTETQVLKQWVTWTISALNAGTIPDIIVDAHHVIQYLKYAATRQLFTTRSKKKETSDRLSSSSLKKIMTMIGRVRGRQEDEDPEIRTKRPFSNSRTRDFYKAIMIQAQRLRLASEDFDVTKGTILDTELRAEQFEEITAAIFLKTQHLPSIIKAHFSWTWQCSTLNRSDEVVSLILSCIQPFELRLPDYTTQSNGRPSPSHRRQFGVLAMYWETKTGKPGQTEPKYSFALPHRNPLRCPVGALAILLHYMFDQRDLISQIPSWDWGNASTWRLLHILFGKRVEESFTGDGLGRMYTAFLNHTSVTSKKKTHLARRTMPGQLEDMGVPADQVDATGHWQGNTRREVYGSKIPKISTVALAGFAVGETYNVPWAQVEVPSQLQHLIFPFCEDAIAKLRAAGCKNQGTFNFLELLQNLRPFFWRAICAIHSQFPNSPILRRLDILSKNEPADAFISQWLQLLQSEEAKNDQTTILSQAFHEIPTQNAFSTLSAQVLVLKAIA